MPTHSISPTVSLRLLCLSIASSLCLTSVPSPVSAATVQVTYCGSEQANVSQPGSLRDVVINTAEPGDVIDLSGCKGSTITLKNGAIPITQDSLAIFAAPPNSAGPPAVTIDGDGTDRVFNHTGTGTLNIKYATIQNGFSGNASQTTGGCISSTGSVELFHSVVRGCTVKGTSNVGGGGIAARCSVSLFDSAISDNYASSGASVFGGGIYAGCSVSLERSSVSGNIAYGKTRAYGGGVVAVNPGETNEVYYSTINNNQAISPSSASAGGIFMVGSVLNIRNSTVSGNAALSPISDAPSAGGLVVYGSTSTATINNSTIAFNSGAAAGGLLLGPGGTADIESAIIANNKTNAELASDLYQIASSPTTLTGAANMVMSSNLSLPTGFSVSSVDPKLGPLQNNGGPTFTHALLAGSPAIAVGNNQAGLLDDQRGPGHPRMAGTKTDIGAFEFDAIFADGFELQ
jgi:hypothetical protein